MSLLRRRVTRRERSLQRQVQHQAAELAKRDAEITRLESLVQELQTGEGAERWARITQVTRKVAIGETLAGSLHTLGNLVGATEYLAGVCERLQPEYEAAFAKGLLTVTTPERFAIRTRHAREAVQVIEDLRDQMADLIEGKPPRYEDASLNSLARKAVRAVEPALGKKKITLIQSYDERLPPVLCNATGVAEVLDSLLRNAIYASPVKGTVLAGTLRQGDHALITVADNGEGMSESVRAKAFTVFFTTKPGRTGTGLGLPRALQVAHDHGGTIEIRSLDEGARTGTVVEVLLPIRGPFQGRGSEGAQGVEHGSRVHE